jgi:uncharacterized membrane protein YoaK (UPF0700 family)
MIDLWTGRRRLWVRLQFCVGVLNAFALLNNIDQGALMGAAISALCVFVTARWRLPPP